MEKFVFTLIIYLYVKIKSNVVTKSLEQRVILVDLSKIFHLLIYTSTRGTGKTELTRDDPFSEGTLIHVGTNSW